MCCAHYQETLEEQVLRNSGEVITQRVQTQVNKDEHACELVHTLVRRNENCGRTNCKLTNCPHIKMEVCELSSVSLPSHHHKGFVFLKPHDKVSNMIRTQSFGGKKNLD